ncbi:hypothetical protein Sste5346_008040 [Sporothrix stenoceras]|uniref:DUF7136 domain-containing protein n=1 Tax=Sporothrix stenoceras TaxID=5173 RepID=A0ABR3YQW8_9PEZI
MSDVTPSNSALVLELDVVFPRAETYAAADVFPIAVTFNDFYGVKPNLSALSWSISGPGDGFPKPTVDDGRFEVYATTTYKASAADQEKSPLAPDSYVSSVLLGYTNVSAWPTQYHLADQLQLSILTDDSSSLGGNDSDWVGIFPTGCGATEFHPAFMKIGSSFGSIVFSIESDAKAVAANDSILQPLAADAPACPAAAGSYLSDLYYKNTTTNGICFEDTVNEDGVANYDTVSCTDRSTVPGVVRTALDAAATSLAKESAEGGGGGRTLITPTSVGASATETGASGTGATAKSGSGSNPTTTSTSTTSAAGNQLPSLRRILTALGVVSLAFVVC